MAVTYSDRSVQRMDVLSSFRWSAIFAGLVVALATQLFLSAVGAALGISATAVTETEGAARGLGIGAGIWMIISPLISMFVGGAVATWLARPVERGVALLHGALVWCLSLVLGAVFVGTIASSAFSGILASAGDVVGDPAARQQLQAEIQEQRAEAGAKLEDPQVKETADRAANVGTGVAWASVLAMLLSFGAALFGSHVAHRNAFKPIGVGRGRDISRPGREEPTRPIVTPTETRPTDEYRPDLH